MENFEKWNQYWWQRSGEEGTRKEILDAIEQNTPRPEYSKGEMPLNYEHRFSTGHLLRVFDNDEGVVTIKLELSDGNIVDLTHESFIPYGLKIITSTYARKHNFSDEYVKQGHWRAGPDYISVGDMKNAKSIFALLHELGHVQLDLKEKLKIIDTENPGPTIHEAQYQSVNERGAWSGALHIVRYLKEKYGLNMMEMFSSVADFHTFMIGNLSAHRYQHEFSISQADKEFLDDPKVKEELKYLFDRPSRLMEENREENLEQTA